MEHDPFNNCSYWSVYHGVRYTIDGLGYPHWTYHDAVVKLIYYVRGVYKLSHRTYMREKQLSGKVAKPLVGEIWLARITSGVRIEQREIKYAYNNTGDMLWCSTDNLLPHLYLTNDINPERVLAIVRLFIQRLWLLSDIGIPNDIFRVITGFIQERASDYKVIPSDNSFIIEKIKV